MTQKKNILVTGGAGFIGSNLVEALLKDERVGIIRVLDDFSNGKRSNLEEFKSNPQLEIVEGDIRDFQTCVDVCKDIHAISHQAALGSVPRSIEDPRSTHNVNITGTAHIFTAAKEAGIKTVVYASSSSVYGDSEASPKKEIHKGRLLSPYALSKSIAEQYADMYALNYGMNFVGLRYFNVFGPKQDPNGPYAAVIPLFMNALKHDVQPKIFGDGEQSRDFTYVSNPVNANILSLFKDYQGGEAHVLNIACGFSSTVNELWDALISFENKAIKPNYLAPRQGDILHSLADISEAKRIIGFNPDKSFDEGLKTTYEWFMKNM